MLFFEINSFASASVAKHIEDLRLSFFVDSNNSSVLKSSSLVSSYNKHEAKNIMQKKKIKFHI